MKRESFTKIFRMGDKETETTTYVLQDVDMTLIYFRTTQRLWKEVHYDYAFMDSFSSICTMVMGVWISFHFYEYMYDDGDGRWNNVIYK